MLFEMIAGLLLGPSVFGTINGFADTTFPRIYTPVVKVFANIGFQLFAFLLGLQLDLTIVVMHWKESLLIAVSVFLLSFGMGIVAALTIVNHDTTEHNQSLDVVNFVLFMGSFFAAAAIPVLVQSLEHCSLHVTKIGSVAVGAVVALNGMMLCPFTLAVCSQSGGSIQTGGWLLLGVVLFAALLGAVVRPALLKWVPVCEKNLRGFKNENNLFSSALVAVLCSGWVLALLGQDPLLGTFLFGAVVPRGGKLHSALSEHLGQFVATLFLPLYFTVVGLSADVTTLRVNPDLPLFFALVALIAASRFVSASAVACLMGSGGKAAAVLGLLLSSTGLVQFVVLYIGRTAEIVSQRVFTLLLLVNIATSLAVPPILRAVYPPRWTPSNNVQTFAMERQERAEPLGAEQLARQEEQREREEARLAEDRAVLERDPEWGERSHPQRLREEFEKMQSTSD